MLVNRRPGSRLDAMDQKSKRGRGTGLAPVTVKGDKLLTDGTDERFRRLINDLHAISACFSRISAKLFSFINLPASQHHILRVVAELGTGNAVTVNKIAEILHMNPTQVTRELNELVRRQLIHKSSSVNDRRQVLLAISDRGIELLEEVAPLLWEINDAMFKEFSRDDFDKFHRLVKTFANNLDSTLLVTDQVILESKKKIERNGCKIKASEEA
jgi:DNA-binding MarR family transcriptional regulator